VHIRKDTVLRTQTAVSTVTTPGGSFVITKEVVRPVVRRHVVTYIKTDTGVVTAVVTRRQTVTDERRATVTQPMTVERTVTSERTVTEPTTITREVTETVTDTVTTPLVIVTVTVTTGPTPP